MTGTTENNHQKISAAFLVEHLSENNVFLIAVGKLSALFPWKAISRVSATREFRIGNPFLRLIQKTDESLVH